MPDVEPTSPLDDLVAARIVAEASEDGDPLDIDPAPPVSDDTASEVLRQLREAERY